MSKKIGKILGIVVGNGIFALGLSAFSMPNHFLVGGATGIARSVQHFAHLDVSVTVAALNVVMFLLGFYILGKRFALTTIVSTLVFPVFLNQFLKIEAFSHLTNDRLLAALFGGMLTGLGLDRHASGRFHRRYGYSSADSQQEVPDSGGGVHVLL